MGKEKRIFFERFLDIVRTRIGHEEYLLLFEYFKNMLSNITIIMKFFFGKGKIKILTLGQSTDNS